MSELFFLINRAKAYRQKGLGIIAVIILFLLMLLGCNSAVSENTQSQWGSFTSEPTYSYDNKYMAEQVSTFDELSQVNNVNIIILDTGTNKEVYRFKAARARDFWGICWENDSYNIWVQSADTGIGCYKYKDETWILDELAQRPDYIVSKYDAA